MESLHEGESSSDVDAHLLMISRVESACAHFSAFPFSPSCAMFPSEGVISLISSL